MENEVVEDSWAFKHMFETAENEMKEIRAQCKEQTEIILQILKAHRNFWEEVPNATATMKKNKV